jgi:hypothetical protein
MFWTGFGIGMGCLWRRVPYGGRHWSERFGIQVKEPAMSNPAIELLGLEHRYETEPVLRGIDLRIEHGDLWLSWT